MGNRKRCGRNTRENRIRKKDQEKKTRGSDSCWKSSDVSAASQKSLFMKRNSTFFFGMVYECVMYTHTWTYALRCVQPTGLYINTFPRHGYSMTFLLPLLGPSAAQTPSHLFGFPLLFSFPFLIICVCGILFSPWPDQWPPPSLYALPRSSSVYPIHLRPFSSISLFFF